MTRRAPASSGMCSCSRAIRPTGRYIVDARELAPGSLTGTDTYFAGYPNAAEQSQVHCPDNLGIDPQGRLWIVTDSDNRGHPNNGCFVVPTSGPQRGLLKQLASGPNGLRSCAAANSRPTAARCFCRSSTRAKAAASTTRAATGPTATGCPRAPHWWPWSARMAARFNIVSRT